MRADTNCEQLATFIVSSMQGPFLLAKAQRDPAPVVNLKEVLFSSVLQRAWRTAARQHADGQHVDDAGDRGFHEDVPGHRAGYRLLGPHGRLIEEGFDVVTRTGDAIDSTLVTRTMGTYRHVIVGSPAYFAQRGVPGEPEQLREHACLQHRFPTTNKLRRWPLMRDGELLNIDLPTTAIATAVEPLTMLAEQELGLACVPDFTIRAQLAGGSLVAVLQTYTDTPTVFRALWPSGRQISPKARVFVDYLGEHLFPVSAAAARGAGHA